MAHVQRRCGSCQRVVPRGERTCRHCGRGAVVYVARYRDPSNRERSRSFQRRVDAERFVAAAEADVNRGAWIDPERGRELFHVFWCRWRQKAVALGMPSERTLIAYDELWRLYVAPSLGARRLDSITRADVLDLVEVARQTSAWRATDALKLTRRLLNAAVDEELITRNPASRVPAPRVELPEPWVLTPGEVEGLANAVGERWRAFVLLAAYSSLRWSELIALRVDRLDLPRRRVRVEEKLTEHGRLIVGKPKTRQSRRSVAIPEFLSLELAEHLRRFPATSEGLVFTALRGGPVRRPHFGRLVWRPATLAVGLEGFPFKNLRHTGASLAIAAGADSMLVAARLGHTSTRMVERHYVSLFDGLDREIGERLGDMRERRDAETKRLRPSPAVSGGYGKGKASVSRLKNRQK